MCGIWCCISSSESLLEQQKCVVCSESSYNVKDQINCQREFVSRRGPDVSNHRCFCSNIEKSEGRLQSENSSSSLSIHLESNVLWTQGEKVYQQPYVNLEENKFMLYNGDIYSFNGFSDDKESPSSSVSSNDGQILFELFEEASTDDEEMCRIIGNLQGPFAFIYVDLTKSQLWFGRDFFGRESLLFSYETEDLENPKPASWNISSVSVFKNVFEVPTSGIFCFSLQTKALRHYPYSHIRQTVSDLESNFIKALSNSNLISDVLSKEDIKIELHFNPKLKVYQSNEAAFENSTLVSLINEAKANDFNVSAEEFLKKSRSHILHEAETFLSCLRKSVRCRVSVLPPFCKDCLQLVNRKTYNDEPTRNSFVCNHAKVGVLFSGGLDSTVLAYLAAEALPKGSVLDLLNVGFSKTNDFSNIPDRQTALASYKMLRDTFSSQGKTINLVLINIRKPEVEEQRKQRIKHLISPLKSVLDDSVGVCLWFAARGRGSLYENEESDNTNNSYVSPIRVVLLGSGADELLGGYGRHRSAYENKSWLGLSSEMQLEIDRISIRNLGRDNRIVSDHGLCPRMPFLDENVVDFVASRCDLWVKCCPVSVGPLGVRGIGEKLLLRVVGAMLFGDLYLSLALFPKRAMQFGSRIAKLEFSKEKGGDICQRLD